MHALNFLSPEAFDHRRRERWLLSFALVFVLLNALALAIQLPAGRLALGVSCLIWLVVIVGLHVGFNRWHPRRDPFILPIYALLTGWGLILIARLALNFLWR